jgi:hypothetical protein
MKNERVRDALCSALMMLLLVGCGGGGGGAAAPSTNGTTLAASATTASPSPAASAGPGGMAVTAFGGLQGATALTHGDGDTFDYAEIVTFTFNHALDAATVANSITIAPSAPFTTYTDQYGKRLQITLRKTPGTVYAITLAAGMPSTDGSTLPATVTYHLTTPANVTVPGPIRVVRGEPYRYGVLVHPYAPSLAGATELPIIGILATMHAGFVRIDYTGAVTMPTSTTTNFASYDAIVSLLAAQGITELPILDQYTGATWQTGGQSYPAIYATPQLYAQFVSTVVAHLAATAPQITRIELFNEPNLTGWWSSPNPAYAATDGSATAQYMLAAYAAAKSANPGITVVGPALADGGPDLDPRTFLTTMYANGCRAGTCWDVLSVHNYAWVDPDYAMPATASNRWQIYQDLQTIAVANGDPKPHVMLTEWGFSTSQDAVSFDPRVQALYMAHGLNLMLADPTIDGIVWSSPYAPGTDFWSRTAVTDPSFNTEPAESTFGAFATP